MCGAKCAARMKQQRISTRRIRLRRMAAGMDRVGIGIRTGVSTPSCPDRGCCIARLGGASTHRDSFTRLRITDMPGADSWVTDTGIAALWLADFTAAHSMVE